MLCECGCGQQTSKSTITDKRRGYKRGEPMKFIAGHNGRASQTIAQLRAEIARLNELLSERKRSHASKHVYARRGSPESVAASTVQCLDCKEARHVSSKRDLHLHRREVHGIGNSRHVKES